MDWGKRNSQHNEFHVDSLEIQIFEFVQLVTGILPKVLPNSEASGRTHTDVSRLREKLYDTDHYSINKYLLSHI